MDLVYIVREGPNEELRYSLRSVAANLPHGRVWIFGGRPRWLTAIEHVHVRQGNMKYDNAMTLFRTIADHPDLAAEFTLMNDDMFVMRPVAEIPVNHWGKLEDVIARRGSGRTGFYSQGMANTLDVLRELGYEHPLSYELHTPLRMTKAGLHQVQNLVDAEARSPLHNRTLYGNIYNIGGEYSNDVKVYDLTSFPSTTLLSTNDKTFRAGKVGKRIRQKFTKPCRFER